MKHYFISLLFCFLSLTVLAQSEASNWYFGYGAGIKFNLLNETVSSLNNGQLFTHEGCTTMSDDLGNLLFYTDGSFIWNKNHQYMANGVGLLGDSSSTHSAIIVPKPNDSHIFYVFTVGSRQSNTGLHYSIVDMTQNNGLGEVTTSNVRLLNLSSEKVTAVLKDCISKSMWVVSFASEDGNTPFFNTFYAYEVSINGVNSVPVKSTFPINISDARGALKLSPDGTKIACANATTDDDNATTNDQLYLYDFDTSTGKVSNPIELRINGDNHNPYGLEFSPNSQLLYVHSYNNYRSNDNNGNNDNDDDPVNHRSTLTQFHVASPNIQNSQVVIDERQLYRGGLQLGPDGKIYRALTAAYGKGLPYLGVIKNPNNIGLACRYEHNAINLSPNESSQGLPPFIQSLFKKQIDIIQNGKSETNLTLCEGGSYRLVSENIPGANYTWTKNNIILPNNTYTLLVTETGHYKVEINPNNGECTKEGQAYVFFNDKPSSENIALIQCDEDGKKDGLTTFNLNEAYKSSSSGETLTYNFYVNPNKTIEINGSSYKNTENPQTVYVRTTNVNTGCFSFSELTLSVSTTYANDTVLPTVCDDDGKEDGLHIFYLKEAEAEILKGIPSSNLNISYYLTYDDALLETNKLPVYFTNTQPYNQTIFARVENANACYGISKVNLTVQKLPHVDAIGRDYYCLNKFPEYISLDTGLIDDDPNKYTYLWNNGDTSYQIQINKIGTYTVTVTSKETGCSKKRSIVVESSNIATFKEINVVDATETNIITIIVTGEGLYNYALYDTKNNLYQPYQESNTFDKVSPGMYHIHVKDIENNCGVVMNQVSVIGYPKFFTPNNDGINDTWQIIGLSEMFQPNTNITIYDRFGKLIIQLSPLREGWNGFLNGQKLPADDYWFSVTLQDGRIFKNHFSLKY
ncbi:T9SS type B sorting domain-containing protein [Mariniflexile litorale]|uniref:T9SS type B sorting domain-containing protein n=1 Tax=Mariniflexile litorale TaxID=3045158 RepID=A0AAU7EH39_9FLAO|nr:T9SS type B sorting domain-containing protein [Mariniflexile sp. KMM 9835]MDQ8210787.1 T9SS type B sorting domain-containing protein [Mariniflexile sp. KMM 9835]